MNNQLTINQLICYYEHWRLKPMPGISNQVPHLVCEVGTCFAQAVFIEGITVIHGDPALKHERHHVDIVLCHRHEERFQQDGLTGIVTAYGDQVAEPGR
jgi:hypothetical protein